MRLGEVLRCEVVTADGRRLGRVSDVRLVQDGPVRRGVQAALRVDALVVGRAGLAERLGFVRHGVSGPWLLRAAMRRLEQRAHVVDAVDVASWDTEHALLRLRRGAQARRLR